MVGELGGEAWITSNSTLETSLPPHERSEELTAIGGMSTGASTPTSGVEVMGAARRSGCRPEARLG